MSERVAFFFSPERYGAILKLFENLSQSNAESCYAKFHVELHNYNGSVIFVTECDDITSKMNLTIFLLFGLAASVFSSDTCNK